MKPIDYSVLASIVGKDDPYFLWTFYSDFTFDSSKEDIRESLTRLVDNGMVLFLPPDSPDYADDWYYEATDKGEIACLRDIIVRTDQKMADLQERNDLLEHFVRTVRDNPEHACEAALLCPKEDE